MRGYATILKRIVVSDNAASLQQTSLCLHDKRIGAIVIADLVIASPWRMHMSNRHVAGRCTVRPSCR